MLITTKLNFCTIVYYLILILELSLECGEVALYVVVLHTVKIDYLFLILYYHTQVLRNN